LACATPFAALAALAALFLPRRDAFVLVGANWLANQAIGFNLMHYPLTWDCFRGGLNLGVACLLCTGAAMAGYQTLRRIGWTLAVIGSFVAAFVVFEGALIVTDLGRSHGSISLPIVQYIFSINGLAFAGLLVLQSLGAKIGLSVPRIVVPPAGTSTAS
jgi:hypothetical protein